MTNRTLRLLALLSVLVSACSSTPTPDPTDSAVDARDSASTPDVTGDAGMTCYCCGVSVMASPGESCSMGICDPYCLRGDSGPDVDTGADVHDSAVAPTDVLSDAGSDASTDAGSDAGDASGTTCLCCGVSVMASPGESCSMGICDPYCLRPDSGAPRD